MSGAEGRRRTEGGEALPQLQPKQQSDVGAQAPWHVLWTHSNCEQKVLEQLRRKGLHPFLPMIGSWSFRPGVQHCIRIPLCPGYLFLHDEISRTTYVEVRKCKGLVSFLGLSRERLAEVPETEVAAVKRLVE